MKNRYSFDVLAHQILMSQQVQLLSLQIQLKEVQQRVLQGNCGGNRFYGDCGTMEGGYGYQPSFDYTPRSDFYAQANSYLPTMVE